VSRYVVVVVVVVVVPTAIVFLFFGHSRFCIGKLEPPNHNERASDINNPNIDSAKEKQTLFGFFQVAPSKTTCWWLCAHVSSPCCRSRHLNRCWLLPCTAMISCVACQPNKMESESESESEREGERERERERWVKARWVKAR